MLSLLQNALTAAGIPGTDEKLLSYQRYMEIILAYNEHINLTAIRDPESFEKLHYVDSLAILGLKEYQKAGKVIDIGTGGGFPGVPLAIASPEKEFVLADSLAKRLKIVEEAAREAGCHNVRTCHGRAEDLGRDPAHREQYDLAVSRAVAALPVLAEYCLPFVKPGGAFIAYKGIAPEAEVKEAEKAIRLLGGKVSGIFSGGTGDDQHHLIVIEKTGLTPKKFPRKAGTPSREPLK